MKKEKLYILVLLLSLAGYVWLAWNIYGEPQVFHACLVKQVTGLPCPSCGATRGLLQLAHGHIVESFFQNPFSDLLAFALAVFPFWIVLDFWRKKESFFRFYRGVENIFSRHRWVTVLGVFLVCLNWYWNILKGF